MKKVLVVGGTGSIGKAITGKLGESRIHFDVVSVGRSKLDVTDSWSVANFYQLHKNEYFDCIVYSVGNCPPYGFLDEVKIRLLDLNPSKLHENFNLHVTGLLRVIQVMKYILSKHSKIIVIGSGITQVTDENCPTNFFAGHYASAISAQDELIKWIRRDPFFIQKSLSIESLKLRAVNTPFHFGDSGNLKPPVMLSLEEVYEMVMTLINK